MLNYTEAARFGQNPSFELRDFRATSCDRTRIGCAKLEARSSERSWGEARDAHDSCHVMLIIDPASGKVL